MLNFFNLFTKTKIKDSVRIGLLMTAFSCSSIQTIKGTTSKEQFQKKVPSINTPSIDNEVGNNAIENDSLKNPEPQNNNTDNKEISFTPPVSNLAQDPKTDQTTTQVESENQDDNKIKTTKDTPQKSSYGLAPSTILSAQELGIPVEKIKETYSSPLFSKFLHDILNNIPAAKEVIQKDATTNPINGVMWVGLFDKMQEIENSNLSQSEKEKSIQELYQSINNTIAKNHSSKTPPVEAPSLNDQKLIKTINEIMTKRIEAGIEEKMVLHEKKMYIIAGITVGAITLICLISNYLSKKKNSDDDDTSET